MVSADEWREQVVAAERAGEALAAVDLAEQGLREHPQSVWLRHRVVLGLARAGSTDEAERRYRELELDQIGDEDVRALAARIAKDRALAAAASARRALASRSAQLYARIFADEHGYYPGINAATMALVAGDPATAKARAEAVLQLLDSTDEQSFYAAATEAEALLLLGLLDEFAVALSRAADLGQADLSAVSTTRRQLRLVCTEAGVDQSVLNPLAGPPVVHFCGHRIADHADAPFPAVSEAEVAERIDQVVARLAPGYAYGALANGADILWAEGLLRHGARLQVVLPFASAEFVEASVADGGPGWVERFTRCLAAADRVIYATDDAYLGDDELFRYGSDLAMGLALQRARYLDSAAVQLAVWNGVAAGGPAGTGADVAHWTAEGHRSEVIDLKSPAPTNAPKTVDRPGRRRVVKAILFGDIRGYSKLSDEQLPVFNDQVLGPIAQTLDGYAEAVEFRNTWGDGLYVVLGDSPAAAACALDLQQTMRRIDLAGHGLPGHLALRLSAHVGPVFPVDEPVLGVRTFIGTHISRTARIEPVTPAGAVYVTEPFSANLTLSGSPLACDYVGHLPAAKDFGSMRMYRLRVPA